VPLRAMSNGSTCCEIGLLIEDDWLWRSNGAGNTDFEPDKGAYSDAFKRAAVLGVDVPSAGRLISTQFASQVGGERNWLRNPRPCPLLGLERE
jgi:hypothetical protein